MKKPKTPPNPTRWFAPDEKTLKRMIAMGIPETKIYRGHKGEVPGKFHMRRGEFLGVLDGLRSFGPGKRAINNAVAEIHDDGATIIDIETGQDSRTHGVAMANEASRPRKLLTETEKLAQADARRKKDGKMIYHDAHSTWFGPGTVEQKADATGWSKSALHKEFGPSGAPAGRPPKDKKVK